MELIATNSGRKYGMDNIGESRRLTKSLEKQAQNQLFRHFSKLSANHSERLS